METTPKEVTLLFERLMATMVELLNLDPGNAWYLIAEAHRRVLSDQIDRNEQKTA